MRLRGRYGADVRGSGGEYGGYNVGEVRLNEDMTETEKVKAETGVSARIFNLLARVADDRYVSHQGRARIMNWEAIRKDLDSGELWLLHGVGDTTIQELKRVMAEKEAAGEIFQPASDSKANLIESLELLSRALWRVSADVDMWREELKK